MIFPPSLELHPAVVATGSGIVSACQWVWWGQNPSLGSISKELTCTSPGPVSAVSDSSCLSMSTLVRTDWVALYVLCAYVLCTLYIVLCILGHKVALDWGGEAGVGIHSIVASSHHHHQPNYRPWPWCVLLSGIPPLVLNFQYLNVVGNPSQE